MDLSALIFVALAVAWAVYLVPKALKHHEIDRVSRPVESFSDRMRVLARREPLAAGRTALVVGTPAPPRAEPAPAPPAEPQRHRAAAAQAARRRRRVLGAVLLVNLVVLGLAAAGVLSWAWETGPAALLVGWLVACRLMVRSERAVRTAPVRRRRTTLADQVIAEEDAVAHDDTDEIPAVAVDAEPAAPAADPDSWEPVPVTLPTYVAKAAAGRTVRTIDLDSTGVWSSGRNAADSVLAREANQQYAADVEAEPRQVSGA